MKKFCINHLCCNHLYGDSLILWKDWDKTTTGVHDPDIALSENTAMEIFYTGGQKTSYF